jgi:small acid-soluble spore protein D (minor alpha/beta-type SASP)
MSRNRVNIPESEQALEKMKYEIASELGVNLKQGYNGDLSSRDNGYVGGYMVKKMITDYQNQASGK